MICDALIYEPNDDPSTAYGPLESKATFSAYIHESDVDFYSIDVKIPEPIKINLRDIPEDVDYDMILAFGDSLESLFPVEISEGENTETEYIFYTPPFTGTFYIVIYPYEGYSLQAAYTLQSEFNGDVAELGNVTVLGRLVNADTGQGIPGVNFLLLKPGVTVEQFMNQNGDESLLQSESVTDDESVFVLENVPRGQTFSAIVMLEFNYVWQDDWLTISNSDPDTIDVGDININVQE